MSNILFRTKSSKWLRLDKRKYKSEAELQNLLYDYPEIIPIADIEDGRPNIAIFIKEFSLTDVGSSDVVGLDPEGRIYIIETKLAVNPEAKRKVVGQIFDYASSLWELSFDEFDSRVVAREGDHLLTLLSKKIKEDFNDEMFKNTVEKNLANGSFTLIIAVDEVDERLKRIIDYLNIGKLKDLELYALEMQYYQTKGEQEVLTPRFYGVTTIKQQPQTYTPKPWDKDLYYDYVTKNNPDLRERYGDFEIFLSSLGDKFKVEFGGGEKEGYMKLYFQKQDGDLVQLIALDNTPTAKLWIEMKKYKSLFGSNTDTKLSRFIIKAKELTPFKLWKNTPIEELKEKMSKAVKLEEFDKTQYTRLKQLLKELYSI